MKKALLIVMIFSMVLGSAACSQASGKADKKGVKIGVMLSDIGLGDQSFSDAGFSGLEKARNKLGITFDYKELADTGDYETGLRELANEGNDLIIGLGFTQQAAVDKVAAEYPNKTFLLIDSKSDVKNVNSVTFKEEQGSYLIGYLAGMKTKSKVVGFIGGLDVPLIRKFAAGYLAGVKAANPSVKVLIQYAGDFGNAPLGSKMADQMITKGADFIYPAAGLTGSGALKTAQNHKIYSFGVDSDQYFLAEKSVVSSMVKRIDNAIYSVVKDYVKTGKIPNRQTELGLKEQGVDIAEIRVIKLTVQEKNQIDSVKADIESGKVTVPKDY